MALTKGEKDTSTDEFRDSYTIQRIRTVIEKSLCKNKKHLNIVNGFFDDLEDLNVDKKDLNHKRVTDEGIVVQIEALKNKEHTYKLSITEGDAIDTYYYYMPRGEDEKYSHIFMKGRKLKERQLFDIGSKIEPLEEEIILNGNDENGKSIDGEFTDIQKELVTRLSHNEIDSKKLLIYILNDRLKKYTYRKKTEDIEEVIQVDTSFYSETEKRDFKYQFELQYNRNPTEKSNIVLVVNDSKASIVCYMNTKRHLPCNNMEYEEFIVENPDIDLEPIKKQIKVAKEFGIDISEIPAALQPPQEQEAPSCLNETPVGDGRN